MKTQFVLPWALICACIAVESQTQARAAQAEPTSPATYPQIVRISYVEGDVRIARGARNNSSKDAVWEKAIADLPLETGYSLVTGAGRTEIELEDASTFYLAENSVLTFNDLHTTGDVPYTEVALLSGTVSLHVVPYAAGEVFLLKTPVKEFTVTYGDKSNFQVSSYLDGTVVTAPEGGAIRLRGSATTTNLTQAVTYRADGQVVPAADAGDVAASADWDKWVDQRVAQRSAAIANVMKASGLTVPIPGMAEMDGKGKFFDCAPYGTCWDPLGDDDQKDGALDPSSAATSPSGQIASANSTANVRRTNYERPISGYDGFPCSPFEDQGQTERYTVEEDLMTHNKKIINDEIVENQFTDPVGYDWGVCDSGSWIYSDNQSGNGHYVWVAGHRHHHHHHPIHWVKNGHNVGFVPIHPKDVKGQPPINAWHRVFKVSNEKGRLSVERIKFDTSHPIEALNLPPKEFRRETLRPLTRASEPPMQTRMIADAGAGSKANPVKAVAIPLNFDRKSNSFMMASHGMQGGKSVTIMRPVGGGNGNLQARAGGGSYGGSGGARTSGSGGSSGSRSSSSSGGTRSSGSSGSGSGGGGSRSSGGSSGGSSNSGGGGSSSGYSGGGGGSHSSGGSSGGGGGGSSSSSSSSSGSVPSGGHR
jgi:hypothetical protein